MSSSNNYVYFGLRGDVDPDALAAEIGIEPTESRAKHSRDPERKIPRTSLLRFAQVHADKDDECPDVYELAEAVCGQLRPHASEIARAVKAHGLEATLERLVLRGPADRECGTADGTPTGSERARDHLSRRAAIPSRKGARDERERTHFGVEPPR